MQRLGRNLLIVLALSAFVFVSAVLVGQSAAESPNNCGELPGITRTVTSVFGLIGAAVIALVGLIAAAISKRRTILLASLLVGLALAVGIVLGIQSARRDPCAQGGPLPTRQEADLRFEFIEPYPGARPSGKAECRRQDRGGPVSEVVSEVNYAPWTTAWRFGDPHVLFVAIEIWPVRAGPYRPAEHVRIAINRLPEAGGEGASSYYSDGANAAIDLTSTPDGSSGRIDFSDLPLWSPDAVFGTGLPKTISGQVSWTCHGEEE